MQACTALANHGCLDMPSYLAPVNFECYISLKNVACNEISLLPSLTFFLSSSVANSL